MTATPISVIFQATTSSVRGATFTTGTQVDALEAITNEDRPSSPGGRPWVYVNMVASIDGATAMQGVSASLGGPADKLVFSALRAQADVIVAGAQTVRTEQYRAPQTHPEIRQQRLERGQAAKPLIVVVSASGSLTPDMALFADPDYVPMVVTGTQADTKRLNGLEGKARIVVQPNPRVDLAALVDFLGSEGHKTCLVEGGPSLNGQFVADGLVDEWNMTLSPILASGDSNRAAHGPAAQEGQRLDLVRLWHADGVLFGRWVRRHG